jgi:hypothetical protein
MQLFCIEVAQWRDKPLVAGFRRWLMALIALSVVLPLWAAGAEQPWALTAWHVALAVTFLGFGAVFLRRALDTSNWAHRLVGAAPFAQPVGGRLGSEQVPDIPQLSGQFPAALFFAVFRLVAGDHCGLPLSHGQSPGQ